MAVRPGMRVGPYEIVALIGAGGMGEVYRARDTRLGRDVAIKVLPAEFASDPERLRRFEQEARAVAGLSHPNVLAIFDVGTHEATPFLVTELLEGETLRERLSGGAMPVRKAVELAVQIAQGLAAAHEKGIVHRDLKPGNVFITKDNHVKILDFGIAKLVPPRAPEEQARATTVMEATEASTVLGTVGYMSPEQVRGQAVDQRSDIFSFGCVLYEMISGTPPFKRDTIADTMSAILTKDPPELAGPELAVSASLEHVVRRCLEKEASQRFSSAHDLAFALSETSGPLATSAAPIVGRPSAWRRRLLVPSAVGVAALLAVVAVRFLHRGPPARPSVAAVPKIVVLPFENLGSQEDAYFAAGMTEEITSRLANVQGLGVISRTSAVEYNRKGKTVKQIGSDLGVDYVLEGSVRWDRGAGRESRVRITPQLIRVADDTHVWADRYERVIADVFAMQSEVAESTVKAMGVAVLPHEKSALKEISTNDLKAYDLYLRGQEFFNGGTDRRYFEGALQMYQAAVDRDPRFAQALAGLAESHLLMYWYYYDRSPDRIVKAKEGAERAAELRPDLAETHAALGYYFYYALLDYPRALSEFATALKIQPNNSKALRATGYVLRRQGHWADSADMINKALELDPRDASTLSELGESCMLARRYADADRAWGRAIGLNPQWAVPYMDKAWLQVQWHGDVQKTQAVLDEAGPVAGLTDSIGVVVSPLELAVVRGDYQASLRQLESETHHAFDNLHSYLPIPLLRGQLQRLAGQDDLARRSFEAARLEVEEKVKQAPDDHRFHGSLGIAYAGLGRRVEAVREAKLGCDLMPVSKDAYRALYRLQDLALVYTMVGQSSEAIGQLDDLLARSGWVTPHVLRLQPWWDPLRSDPRFQALLTKYEVKP